MIKGIVINFRVGSAHKRSVYERKPYSGVLDGVKSITAAVNLNEYRHGIYLIIV